MRVKGRPPALVFEETLDRLEIFDTRGSLALVQNEVRIVWKFLVTVNIEGL